jgi:hypothetical protein
MDSGRVIRLGESVVIILTSLVVNILLLIDWQIFVTQQNTNATNNLQALRKKGRGRGE